MNYSSKVLDKRKHEKFLSFTSDISDISKPLKNLGIEYFKHLRLYRDFSFIAVANDASWLQYFLDEAYYGLMPPPGQASIFLLGSDNLLWGSATGYSFHVALRDNFNIDNGVAVVKSNKTYVDIYVFASTTYNYMINQFYLNNIDLLERFIQFYNEQGSLIISQCVPDFVDQDLIKVPDLYDKETRDLNTLPSINSQQRDKFIASCQSSPQWSHLSSPNGAT